MSNVPLFVAKPKLSALDARVALIDNCFNFGDDTTAAAREIRQACQECAKKIRDAAQTVPHDYGRLIAAIDQLQQVKNTACDAVILPHAE